MDTDWALLDRFAKRGDQGAFGELVGRHVDWVYGCARRTLARRGLAGEAEDVTQAVFVLLSQKAAAIRQSGNLAGWLFRATRFCCANAVKMQGRRDKHEKEAAMRLAETTRNEEVLAILDEALAALGEKERHVVLLRYLQRLNTHETATALELSAEAVEKRLSRGLEKLRGYFLRQGYAVPASAVAGVLTTEAVRQAPGRLVAAIMGKGSVTAVGIAKGAAMAMAWHSAKLLTMAACTVAVVGVSLGVTVVLAVGPAPRGAPPVATAPAPAMAPGAKAMMARWDLAVTGDLATKIRALAALRDTGSLGYEAYVVDSTNLRQVIAANATNIVSQPQQLMAAFMNQGAGASGMPDIAITNTSGVYGYVTIAGELALVNTGSIGNAWLDQKRDAVRLKIEDEKHTLTIDTNPPQKHDAQVKFAGDVPIGSAAIFVGDLGTLGTQPVSHVSVWEAFAATQEEWGYMAGMPVSRWMGTPVADMKTPLTRAIAWNNAVKENLVPAAWEKKLEGGTIVRLYAVSNPARWPWVWWNGDGQAIRVSPSINEFESWWPEAQGNTQREVYVEVQDPFTALAPPTPPGVATLPANAQQMGHTYMTAHLGQPLKLVAGSGPWTLGPTVAKGETVTVEGVAVTANDMWKALPRTATSPGSTWVLLKFQSDGRLEWSAAAVGKDGKVAGSTLATRAWPAPTTPAPVANTQIVNVGMALEDVDHFVIQWRKTQTVTFEAFATEPRVSPEQVKAPVAAASASAPPVAKNAVDLESPEGFYDNLLAAAKGHDARKVRALIEAKDKEAQAMADLLAEEMTTELIVFDAAVARFGEEDARSAFATGTLSQRWTMKWKVEGNRATIVPEPGQNVDEGYAKGLVKVGNQWHLEIGLPANMTPEEKDKMANELDKQRKVLAAKRAFAEEITAGKFKDVYDARDELWKRTNP